MRQIKKKNFFNCLKGNKHPTDKQNWAIFIIQLVGVRRVNEVLSLRVNDVQVADQTFSIRGVSKKTDKRQKKQVSSLNYLVHVLSILIQLSSLLNISSI